MKLVGSDVSAGLWVFEDDPSNSTPATHHLQNTEERLAQQRGSLSVLPNCSCNFSFEKEVQLKETIQERDKIQLWRGKDAT